MHLLRIISRIACRLRVWSGVQRWSERRADGGAILLYHGVVDRLGGGRRTGSCLDVDTFETHLQFFRKRREIVPLWQIIERLRRGERVPRDWLAITLDDALRSQVTLAAELLKRYDCAWSLTVPVGLIGTGRSIWVDELRFLLMRCWPYASVPSPQPGENPLPTSSQEEKWNTTQQLFGRLLNRTSDQLRDSYLEELIDRAGREEFLQRLADDGAFALAGWEDLARLQDSGVELISHGWKHRPQNATICEESLVQELIGSRREMAQRIGQAPAGFALPSGQRCERTDQLLREAGYDYCLSSRTGRLCAGTELFDIPRFDAEHPLAVLRHHLMRCDRRNSNGC
jgi:peptidoglycan/xylan/chitin deacetylase (PgdA/CDA1 family)